MFGVSGSRTGFRIIPQRLYAQQTTPPGPQDGPSHGQQERREAPRFDEPRQSCHRDAARPDGVRGDADSGGQPGLAEGAGTTRRAADLHGRPLRYDRHWTPDWSDSFGRDNAGTRGLAREPRAELDSRGSHGEHGKPREGARTEGNPHGSRTEDQDNQHPRGGERTVDEAPEGDGRRSSAVHDADGGIRDRQRPDGDLGSDAGGRRVRKRVGIQRAPLIGNLDPVHVQVQGANAGSEQYRRVDPRRNDGAVPGNQRRIQQRPRPRKLDADRRIDRLHRSHSGSRHGASRMGVDHLPVVEQRRQRHGQADDDRAGRAAQRDRGRP